MEALRLQRASARAAVRCSLQAILSTPHLINSSAPFIRRFRHAAIPIISTGESVGLNDPVALDGILYHCEYDAQALACITLCEMSARPSKFKIVQDTGALLM